MSDKEKNTADQRRIDQLETELRQVRAQRHVSPDVFSEMQLKQLEKQVEIQLTLARQDIEQRQLKVAIEGNGKPGLLTRVDRIEQTEKRLTWYWRAMITGLFAAAAMCVFGIVQSSLSPRVATTQQSSK